MFVKEKLNKSQSSVRSDMLKNGKYILSDIHPDSLCSKRQAKPDQERT